MKKKRFAMAAVCAVMTIALAGCSMLSSKLNDITGKLVGNSYTITTYDNYGNRVMTTTGDKINVQGNAVETSSYDSDGNVITGYELSSVITITINASGKITDNTAIAGVLNKYKNMFGKARVVVIKSQLGQPIVAYSGEDVYWEIPDDLPKFTKLMIDGKALYIHRANFQIIDKSLLESN